MNSGFDPMIVAPSLFRRQTASQQAPFHFGGSQVPLHLGMKGRGMTSSKVKPEPKPKEPVSAETQALRDFIKMKNKKQKDILAEMIAMREKKIKKKDYSEGGRIRGGMMVEAGLDEIDITPETANQLKEMANETYDLLEQEEEEMGENPNITTKKRNLNAVLRRIAKLVQRRLTEAKGRQIIDYLQDYTQSPIQPYVNINF